MIGSTTLLAWVRSRKKGAAIADELLRVLKATGGVQFAPRGEDQIGREVNR